MNEHTTWSPGSTLVTPGPTASITPAPSWPPTIGNRGGSEPSDRCRSEWHRPAAVYLTSTSPGPGSSRSSSMISNGSPMPDRTAALVFMMGVLSRRGPAGRAGGGACGGPGAHYARAPDSQLDVHRAGLGVEVESTLAQLAAPAGLLEATERHRGVEAVVLVHPHRAGLQAARDLVGLGDVLGPHAGGQAVHRVVGLPDRVVEVRESQGGDDGAEDLVRDHPVLRLDVDEHGGLDEVAGVAVAAAAGECPAAVLDARTQVVGHLVELVLVDHRAELGGGVEPVADGGLGGGVGHGLRELLVDRVLHVEAGAGRAGLAVAEHPRGHGSGDGGVPVAVGEDDVGALAAQLERDFLEVALGGVHDELAHLGGTGEGDLVHVVVRGDGGAGVAEAGDDVGHTRRDPGL